MIECHQEVPSTHRTKSLASACIPEETGGMVQVPGLAMSVLALQPPRESGPHYSHWASASWPDTRILQRQVGHTMVKPLEIYAGTQTRGFAKESFQGQLASSST